MSEYRPLNSHRKEIRLLTVQPSSDVGVVVCSFRTARLETRVKPRYETISYVWGDANDRATVKLNGRDKDVTASCERVLRRLRRVDRTRVLWIDALCINQADLSERTSQVALMYDIYSNTTRNLIWLGEGDETTAAAVECIYKIVEDMRVETDNFRSARDTLCDSAYAPKYASHGLSFLLTSDTVDAIDRLYSSEWFRRLWIVQEAATPPDSICFRGDQQCPLGHILKAAVWLEHKRYHMPLTFSHSNGLQNAVRMFDYADRDVAELHASRPTFTNILIDTRGFETSDPKDQVFAVLGLARLCSGLDELPELLRPDYSKPLASIYRDAAWYCIASQADLSILGQVRHRLGTDSIGELPTWVPSWNETFDASKDPEELQMSLFRACAAEKASVQIQSLHSGDQLCVHGVIVDQVVVTTICIDHALLGHMTDLEYVDTFVSAFDEEDEDVALRQSHDALRIAMTLTAGCDHVERRWDDQMCKESSAAYDRVVRMNEGVEALRETTTTLTGDGLHASQFTQAMHSALNNRRLFITKGGEVGLGPRFMEPDDILAILYGCRTPAILHRVEKAGNEYEFVGSCYVYGLMDGEAVDRHRAVGGDDHLFCLT